MNIVVIAIVPFIAMGMFGMLLVLIFRPVAAQVAGPQTQPPSVDSAAINALANALRQRQGTMTGVTVGFTMQAQPVPTSFTERPVPPHPDLFGQLASQPMASFAMQSAGTALSPAQAVKVENAIREAKEQG